MRSSGWKRIIALVLCMVMMLSMGTSVISAEESPIPTEVEMESPAETPVTIEITDPGSETAPAPEGEPASVEEQAPAEKPASTEMPTSAPEPASEPESDPQPAPAPAEEPAPAVDPETQPATEAAPAQPAADTTEQPQVPDNAAGSISDADKTVTPGTPEAAASGEAAPAKEKEEEKKPEEAAPMAKKLENTIQSVSGATVKVTLECEDAAGLPEGSVLAVREVVPDTQEYQGYLDAAAAKLEIEDADRITLSRFFDLSIWKDGVKIQPKAPVKVKIEYTSPAERNEGDSFSIVHFADTGAGVTPEIIPVLNAKEDLTEINFQQSSFSVTAIVLVNPASEETEEETPAEDASFSAEVYDPATQQTIAVHMMVPADSLPAPADELSLAVQVIQQNQDAVDVVEDQIDDYEDTARETILFDIALMHEGEEIEPLGPVSVTFEGIEVPNDDAQVFHVQDDAPAATVEEISVDTTAQGDIVMETDHFSLYAVTYTVESYIKTFSGETFKITLNYDDAAELPVGAELQVAELLPGTEEYQSYLEASAEKLEIADVNSISFARFFDITIVKDGEKVEPKAPVDVKIEYAEGTEIAEGDTLSVVHFAEAGTEVIEDVEADDALTEISFVQESFSVTGTIIAGPGQGSIDGAGEYAVIIKINDKYYAVQIDGYLMEVDYSEADNVAYVEMEYPIFWKFKNDNGSSNIYVNAYAASFTYQDLPQEYYREYIDPGSDQEIPVTFEPSLIGDYSKAPKPEEDSMVWPYGYANVDAYNVAIRRQNDTYARQCQAIFTDGKISGRGKYIGVDETNLHIISCENENEAATVYLAQVKNVLPSANMFHTVNHIDISISGKAMYDLPLAYGDYYYYVGGELRTLTVSDDNKITLHLQKDDVGWNIDDMKNAEIIAYSKQKGIINDAYYITGYSQNHNTEEGIEAQIRLEGSFKVSDLEPYGDGYGNQDAQENSLSQDKLDARKENRIYYTLTIKKEVEFEWLYEYADNAFAQLYELKDDGTLSPLSSKVMVNVSRTFDYWDDGNLCPPVSMDKPKWNNGHIVWDTSGPTGSGMDFEIRLSSDEDILAVEITKFLKTNTGGDLYPKSATTNQFIVYANTSATQAEKDAVADVGIGDGAPAADYSNYSPIHVKSITVGDSGQGATFDYEVNEGLLYIEEDQNSIKQQITDTDGKEWRYVKTYIDTEYAWRTDGDEHKPNHRSEGLISIPEVLGNYGTWNDQGTIKPLRNGFLEFYVYNVYEPVGYMQINKQVTYHGNNPQTPEEKAALAGDYTYTVYTDADCSEPYMVGSGNDQQALTLTITIGTDGEAQSSDIIALPVGQYWIKETGFTNPNVKSTQDIISIEVTSDNLYTSPAIANSKNDLPEPPHKKETSPGSEDSTGVGECKAVQVGDLITYEISYNNYKETAATVTIKDKLDPNVEYVSTNPQADGNAATDGIVTWTLTNAATGTGKVTLTVKVKEGALKSKGGSGQVVNGGNTATVKVGGDDPVPLETVTNPVPDKPVKQETQPFQGTGTLGAVKVGDTITYEISYNNYKKTAATVTIKDKLDPNVEYVSSNPQADGNAAAGGIVTWTLTNVDPGPGTVTLTVRVKESAKGLSVVNGGSTATVQVATDDPVPLETVTNPVPDLDRTITGTAWFDKDQDGVREDDDELLKGVTIILQKKGTDGNFTNFKTTTTNDNGFYSFEDLPEGEYRIVFDRPQDTTTKSDVPDGKNSIVDVEKDPDGNPTDAVITGVTLPPDTEIIGMINDGTLPDGHYVKDKQDGGFIENTPVKPHKKETTPGSADGTGVGDCKAVKVGDLITYEISYKNYKTYDAKVVISDKLDKNVELDSATPTGYTIQDNTDGTKTVIWTLPGVKAGKEDKVTLTVKVLGSALVSQKGPGQVVNGGNSATVTIGNDKPVPLETVTNPVPELDRTITGTAWFDEDQDGVRDDDDELLKDVPIILQKKGTDGTFTNYKTTTTNDNGVYTFEDLPEGEYRIVFDRPQDTTTKSDVPDGKNSIVDVEKDSDGNPTDAVITGVTLPPDTEIIGMINDGTLPDGHYVKDKQDGGFIENPPVAPHKKETSPGSADGTGVGDCKPVYVDGKITYEISYKNYKTYDAKVVISDKLDKNVELDSATPTGYTIQDNTDGTKTVVWTLTGVKAGTEGKVTLTVKVKEEALKSKGGPGQVVNGGNTATVTIGNDDPVPLETVTNPVPDLDRTITGTAWFDKDKDGVRGDDDEFLKEVPIILQKKGEDGTFTEVAKTVTDENGVYTFEDLPDGEYRIVFNYPQDTTTQAEEPDGKNSIVKGEKDPDGNSTDAVIEEVKLPTDTEIINQINDGTLPDGHYVKDKQDGGFIADPPTKKEIKPYEGNGFLDAVNVGDTITYEITYKNYQAYAATVTIKDTLDKNVEFVEASNNGKLENGVVTWTIENVAAGKEGSVTLTVKVLGSALASQKGPGKVVNGGDTATVQVGNGKAYTLDKVENPVAKLNRTIQGVAWVDKDRDGIREETDTLLGNVKIKLYRKQDNGTYKLVQSTVTNKDGFYKFDGLDEGTYQVVFDRAQTTTTKADEPDGKNSIVEEQLDENGQPIGAVISEITLPSDEELIKLMEEGKVPNGVFVKDHQDGGFVAEPAKAPHKSEVAPYKGDGTLGSVKVGQEITYQISYQNYTSSAATVTIKDTLDKNVQFVSASNNGKLENGVVTWTIENVAAGKEDSVTLTVKVLEGALSSKQGPGKVVNGGQNATVQIGDGTVYKLNIVTNPVAASSGSSSSSAGGGPRTGDSPMLYVYIGVSLAALIALIVLGVVSRRKKKSQE